MSFQSFLWTLPFLSITSSSWCLKWQFCYYHYPSLIFFTSSLSTNSSPCNVILFVLHYLLLLFPVVSFIWASPLLRLSFASSIPSSLSSVSPSTSWLFQHLLFFNFSIDAVLCFSCYLDTFCNFFAIFCFFWCSWCLVLAVLLCSHFFSCLFIFITL